MNTRECLAPVPHFASYHPAITGRYTHKQSMAEVYGHSMTALCLTDAQPCHYVRPKEGWWPTDDCAMQGVRIWASLLHCDPSLLRDPTAARGTYPARPKWVLFCMILSVALAALLMLLTEGFHFLPSPVATRPLAIAVPLGTLSLGGGARELVCGWVSGRTRMILPKQRKTLFKPWATQRVNKT